ncbi:MAG: ParB N-terminal domain-containing protein [Deltaproteobacteria bacterium]|nr:ParB N-terminal domain-containing protein [Deltaproteobacteria bacterium]
MGRKKAEFHGLTQIPVRQVRDNPRQPLAAEEDLLAERELLAEGAERPVLVLKETNRRYLVLMGGLRLRAARELGWPLIPAIVVEGAQPSHARVVERLEQGEVGLWEFSDALEGLKKTQNWTQAQLAAALGTTRDHVASLLALQQIIPPARRVLSRRGMEKTVNYRHLRFVARLKPDEQLAAARRIAQEGVSSNRLEREKTPPAGPAIRVRPFRRPGSLGLGTLLKDWRRYHRQLATDLKRVDRQEQALNARAQRLAEQARRLQRAAQAEAKDKRRLLDKELRLAEKKMREKLEDTGNTRKPLESKEPPPP